MHVGAAAIVARPGTLVELWRVLEAGTAAGCAIILQAANTGLTGGSSPSPRGYDRPVVIVSVLRLSAIHLVAGGAQAICLPGSTLDQLERRLRPIGREPHSVIGSSCLGASVTGGICNNSGGSLVQRGPAYTEFALFAQVDAGRRLRLVNHLGIDLGDTPEAMLERLERGDFAPAAAVTQGESADASYRRRLRDLDAAEPALFNADVTRLHDASGCAGKLAVFAVRVDSFPAAADARTYYIGTNDPAQFTALRREALSALPDLPVAAEYLHRDAFDIADTHGRDIYLAVRLLGARHLTDLFRMRLIAEGLAEGLLGRHAGLLHVAMHAMLRSIPTFLPRRMREFRGRFRHHLILKIEGAGDGAWRALLARLAGEGDLDFFACTASEARAAFGHRFAIAGAANNFRLSHRGAVGDLIPLDVALLPDDRNWHDFLPPDAGAGVRAIGYGHFFCHVFHLDYLVDAGQNAAEVKGRLTKWLRDRRARYPAEHNFGHLYRAPPEVIAHYRALDPTNSLNPGVGCTSHLADWAGEPPT